MGILCRICQRVKWALLTLLIIGGASLLVFLHIEEYKQISHLAQEIGTFYLSTFESNFLLADSARKEDELAHSIRTVSLKLANISDHHMLLGKEMRRLDGLLQKDRHKIKIFGVSEKLQGENFTEETG